MNWSGALFGRWLGGWLGSSGDNGTAYCQSAQALDATTGSARGTLAVAGNGSATLDAISGTATASLAIVGASSATLGDVAVPAPAAAPPKPFAPTVAGWFVGRRVLPAIAGRSDATLDDVSGAAVGTVGNVATVRQRKGRRDDMDLMVSGWR